MPKHKAGNVVLTGTVVPIPAAWLFGSALMGMAVIGYRKSRAKQRRSRADRSEADTSWPASLLRVRHHPTLAITIDDGIFRFRGKNFWLRIARPRLTPCAAQGTSLLSNF